MLSTTLRPDPELSRGLPTEEWMGPASFRAEYAEGAEYAEDSSASSAFIDRAAVVAV
jgi:hypothetical protein